MVSEGACALVVRGFWALLFSPALPLTFPLGNLLETAFVEAARGWRDVNSKRAREQLLLRVLSVSHTQVHAFLLSPLQSASVKCSLLSVASQGSYFSHCSVGPSWHTAAPLGFNALSPPLHSLPLFNAITIIFSKNIVVQLSKWHIPAIQLLGRLRWGIANWKPVWTI